MTTAAFTLRDSFEFFIDDYDVHIRCTAFLIFMWFVWIGDDARYELWRVWLRPVVLFCALSPLCALLWYFAPANIKQERTFLKWMTEVIYATKRVHYCGDGECDCFAPRPVLPSAAVASHRAVSAPVALSSGDILSSAASSASVLVSGRAASSPVAVLSGTSSSSASVLLSGRAVSGGVASRSAVTSSPPASVLLSGRAVSGGVASRSAVGPASSAVTSSSSSASVLLSGRAASAFAVSGGVASRSAAVSRDVVCSGAAAVSSSSSASAVSVSGGDLSSSSADAVPIAQQDDDIDELCFFFVHLSCDDPFDEDVHMRILDRRDSEPEPVPVAMPVPVPMPVQVPVPEPVPVPVLESIDAMELIDDMDFE
ncbi:hypothetical protein LRAMOSA11387 [Lichtheimia ramosa]|uniref:Uncharacterized protein n=1 Tax=Lichtheimia ramosa TaxID=688394 RepID=A0A077WTH8_9FUNG|nr:hypothetical protein LRAMOSA11387 [Lichtheimia ramosa]